MPCVMLSTIGVVGKKFSISFLEYTLSESLASLLSALKNIFLSTIPERRTIPERESLRKVFLLFFACCAVCCW